LWGGIALIVIGGLFLLSNLNVFEMARIARFWPDILWEELLRFGLHRSSGRPE